MMTEVNIEDECSIRADMSHPRSNIHLARRFWVLTNKINLEDVLKLHFCSYLA